MAPVDLRGVRWPWVLPAPLPPEDAEIPHHEAELRAARTRPHRTCRPRTPPVACSICPADATDLYALVDGQRMCLRCGMQAMVGG